MAGALGVVEEDRRTSRSILIVEDEGPLGGDLHRILSREGYGTVDLVHSADEALATAGKRRPDLVLMDSRVDLKFNGTTTGRHLHEVFEAAVVYLDEPSTAPLRHPGFREPPFVLLKPVRSHELLSAVSVALYLRDSRQRLVSTEARYEELVRNMESRLEEAGRLRRALTAAAEEWRLSFDGVPAAVIVLDSRGRVRRLNRAAASLATREPSGCIGMHVEDLSPGEPWGSLRSMWDHREGIYAQQLVVREKESVWNLSLHRISKNPELWLGRAVEITRDVELAALVGREKRSAELGLFVAGIAHEVRNPLFAILANLDALEDVSEGAFHGFAVRIRREAERLKRLMTDLLEYGKPSPPRIQVVDLGEVWKGIEPELRRAADAAGVDLVASAEWTRVLADAGRLSEVLANLVENALQHTPRGGLVVLRGAEREGLYGCSVEDTGRGFVAEDLGSVFEPFYTRRKGGTGLGLAIVKRFTEEMGGSVVALNRPEGGAAVIVTLRRAPRDE